MVSESWKVRFYASRPWRELRRAIIAERGPTCERCGKVILCESEIIGHHKIRLTPDNVSDAGVALNPDNVSIICAECHDIEHKRFKGSTAHKDVYLIYGAPCSGKTTLVEQMRERGDLVIDMDLIYMAVSGCAKYDKPNALKNNAFAVRDLLLDNVKTRFGFWQRAFIVGGYPHRAQREDLERRLGAEVIYCDATIDECLARADERGVFAEDWRRYIRRWFDDHD